MKVIIAGSRGITDIHLVEKAVEASGYIITEVVSGAARGVDTLGECYAQHNDLPISQFPADWKRYGVAAGPIRNGEMASYAEALIAVWDGKSRGTADMIKQAQRKGLKVFVWKT